MDSFDRALQEILSRSQQEMTRVEEEMRQRARGASSISHAREILAEAEDRLSAIIKLASEEIDRLALAEKRKE